MLINSSLVHQDELWPVLDEHIDRVFTQTGQQLPYLHKAIAEHITDFLGEMLPDLWINVESPYVDKVYRDSYYQYYATKLASFSKDCIRLSFFDVCIDDNRFLKPTAKNRQYIQDHYLGFLVIRPTLQNPIGRNVLSPRAFKTLGKSRPIRVCQTLVSATCNGVKLTATGFPHSAQDVETVTCSQTTLWAVMEYFSHRYPEYRPILPSTIVNQLTGMLVERNLPAPGLSVEQLSFVLKENGFAPRIYLRDDYDEKATDLPPKHPTAPLRKEFDALLSCYVASGIPVVVAVEDGKRNGHAMICIGYVDTTQSTYLDKTIGFKQLKVVEKPIGFFDLDQLPRDFVFIDDNHPPYVSTRLATPTAHYLTNPQRQWRAGFDWDKGHITAFVVPLYRKVYLEAYEAKRYVRRLLALNLLELDDDLRGSVCMRLFLTSSRSYKDNLLNDDLLPNEIKQFIMQTSMPKLIWVGELTNPALLAKNQVFGVVLLDATEADTNDHNALIFAVSPGIIANFAGPNPNARFLPTEKQVEPFSRYTSNLN